MSSQPTRPARLAFLLVALASATPALALDAVKYPSGPVTAGPWVGTYVARPGDVLRWRVVLDNTRGASPVTLDYRDVMDPAGIATCDPTAPPACEGVSALRLACPSQTWDPNYPALAGGTLATCDPASGTIEIAGVVVPAFGIRCLEFSTLVDASATARVTGNLGCLTLRAPTPGLQGTTPPAVQVAGCSSVTAGPLGCTEVLLADEAPPGYSAVKRATFADDDGDGDLDIGELVTWTLDLVNTGSTATVWVADPIPAGLAFESILLNPDAACNFSGTRVTCSSLQLPTGVTKTLRFTTRVDCGAATDDDSYDACNQALVCDTGSGTCFASDSDATPPVTRTCLALPFTSFSGATKTVRYTDVDGNGTADAGDFATYTIAVTNLGRLGSAGVRIVDSLNTPCIVRPPVDTGGGTYDAVRRQVTWDLGPVDPGESRSVELTVELAQPAGVTTCCNQADVVTEERAACGLPPLVSDNPRSALADDRSCILFGSQASVVAEKTIALATDTNGDTVLGDTDVVDVVLVVRNDGQGPAANVTLDDALDGCLGGLDPAMVAVAGDAINDSRPPAPSWPGGLVRAAAIGGADGLVPGESVTITASGILVTDPAGAGCCNQARVTFEDGDLVGLAVTDDPATPVPGDALCTAARAAAGVLRLTRSAVDSVPDGCVEPGETVTVTIDVEAVGGDVRDILVRDYLDPVAVFASVDAAADGGTVVVAEGRVEWPAFDLAAGVTRSLRWTGRASCTGIGSLSATAVASATGTPSARAGWTAALDVPQVLVAKAASFADANGNLALDPGEIVTYDVTLTNQSTCIRPVVVVEDILDADLDAALAGTAPPALVGATGVLTWDATNVPALGGMTPGAVVNLSITVPALDPATNGISTADGVADNIVSATVAGGQGCGDALFGDIAATIDIVGDVLPATLLRERRVSCRTTADVAAYLAARPAPQECSNPSAIDPDRILAAPAVSPVVIVGDGLPVGSRCPPDGTDRGTLIFYELDKCTTTLRVGKSRAIAGALVVTW